MTFEANETGSGSMQCSAYMLAGWTMYRTGYYDACYGTPEPGDTVYEATLPEKIQTGSLAPYTGQTSDITSFRSRSRALLYRPGVSGAKRDHIVRCVDPANAMNKSSRKLAKPDPEEIATEEREILERFQRSMQVFGPYRVVDSAVLVGTYPETVIRMTATQYGQTRSEEWSIWDGSMVGCPPGIGIDPTEYKQMLDMQVLYWLQAPYWRSPDPSG